MADQDRDVVREVVWLDVLPWLQLLRCFRLACQVRLMLLCGVGIVLTLFGWSLFGWIFSGDPQVEHWISHERHSPWSAITALVPDRPDFMPPQTEGSDRLLGRIGNPIVGTWEQLSRPVRCLFDPSLTVSMLVYHLLCFLWALVIWSFIGGAVSRAIAVEFGVGERIGLVPMFQHAAKMFSSRLAAPIVSLTPVVLGMFAMFLLGMLLRTDVGTLVFSLIWPLMLLGSLLLVLLLLGLCFGWPLMWPVISVESTDCWDSLSRSYGYTFQRPFHYLFYGIIATGVGLFGWLLISNLAAGVLSITHCATSWSFGQTEMLALFAGESPSAMVQIGAMIIRFLNDCVKLTAVGFLYSYFFSASTVTYFLLRHDVDGVELDEVALDEDAEDEVYGLPPITTDETGAPIIVDPPPSHD